MPKKLLFSLFLILPCTNSFGQGSLNQSYLDEFNQFREQINSEYADFLGQMWEEFEVFREAPMFSKPKPVTVPVAPKVQEQSTKKEIAVKDVKEAKMYLAPPPQPKDKKSKIEKKVDRKDCFLANIKYYGLPLSIAYLNWKEFRLSTTKENGVSALWKEIDKTGANSLIKDLWAYKNNLLFNDWAYFLLVRQVANTVMPSASDDAKIVFQCYMLVNSGYDAKIARADNSLVLLLPVFEEMFGSLYLLENNRKYYLFADKEPVTKNGIFTYKTPSKFKQGSQVSLAMTAPMVFPPKMKSFTAQAAGISVSGQINKHKIDFYNDYPACAISVFAQAPPDEELHRVLIDSFNTKLAGKTVIQKVSSLLTWVQLAFNYKTDGEQFGRERPFFLEENFFYPYNDCEDRAMLFAYLVKHLLKLDVVLLDYPGHIATAVCLPGEVSGRYMMVDNKRFYICDPTYINAKIGDCMTQYKNSKAKVLKYY